MSFKIQFGTLLTADLNSCEVINTKLQVTQISQHFKVEKLPSKVSSIWLSLH